MWATIATKTTGDESYVASHRMEKMAAGLAVAAMAASEKYPYKCSAALFVPWL